MPKEDWIENTVERIFTRAGLYPADPIDSVLDVACGLSLKCQYINAKTRIGVDVYRPYLEKIEATVPYVAIQYDVRHLTDIFLPKSFDIVLLLDIVEHLEKDEALKLIYESESLARCSVIIETPKGFIPQNIDILGHGGHEFQTHRCGFEVADLELLGYIVLQRDYRMCDVRRHTEIDTIDPNIVLLDAIKHLSV